MTEILLEEVNPHGTVKAIVEADDRVCFFYLWGSPESEWGIRKVWVRNLQAAPADIDFAAMEAGDAPMNPAAHCLDESAGARPSPGDLRISWLPEGNGAALFERGRMIAVIPPWSGHEDFNGYSAAARGEGPLAWQLLNGDTTLKHRFAAADDFWRRWSANPWFPIRDAAIAAIERALGPKDHHSAIDGGQWPPRALVRIHSPERVVLITAGMGVLPQPTIEMDVDDSRPFRRIELGVCLPSDWQEIDVARFVSWFIGETRRAWRLFTWLGSGHTLPCDCWRNPRFDTALLVKEHPAVPAVALPDIEGDPVSVLWLLPISALERRFAMEKGSKSLLGKLPATRWKEA